MLDKNRSVERLDLRSVVVVAADEFDLPRPTLPGSAVIESKHKQKDIDFLRTYTAFFDHVKDESEQARLLDSDIEKVKDDLPRPTLPGSAVIESKRKQKDIDFPSIYIDIFDQVKREAENAYLLDSDIEKVKDETYDDSAMVMEEIFKAGVSSPEVDWNEDGSINLSWFLKTGGTSTILLYGDDYAIYNAYLEKDNYVRSVCKIRGNSVFPKLIEILSDITD